MLELGVAQAQSNFTKLLTKSVLIVDKKTHHKKAVMLPYAEYKKLLLSNKQDLNFGSFSQYKGILDDDFQTDDEKYKVIVK
ncbi:MAG: hypothetical protein CR967_00845 [Proteobacteria bacterium]|nr:MAG: hypothetical protein CR967_00845 [Pseudomonadota bacterium]